MNALEAALRVAMRTHFDVLEGHDFVAPDARADERAPVCCVRCGKHRADHADCEMRS